jgi:hypothetical protein
MNKFDWQLLGQLVLALFVLLLIVLVVVNGVDCMAKYANTPASDVPFRCSVIFRR